MKDNDKGLEESMALAKALAEQEEKESQQELEQIQQEMNEQELRDQAAEGDSISSHVNQAYVE
jgi:hypothetical protein